MMSSFLGAIQTTLLYPLSSSYHSATPPPFRIRNLHKISVKRGCFVIVPLPASSPPHSVIPSSFVIFLLGHCLTPNPPGVLCGFCTLKSFMSWEYPYESQSFYPYKIYRPFYGSHNFQNYRQGCCIQVQTWLQLFDLEVVHGLKCLERGYMSFWKKQFIESVG